MFFLLINLWRRIYALRIYFLLKEGTSKHGMEKPWEKIYEDMRECGFFTLQKRKKV